MDRMRRATEEADLIANYDYIIVNDDLNDSVRFTHELINMQRYKTANNNNFIIDIKNNLTDYLKGEK